MLRPGDVVTVKSKPQYGKLVVITKSSIRPTDGTKAAREYIWIIPLNPSVKTSHTYPWITGYLEASLIREDIPF